ncbi:MAG: ferrous iron transport protein B [Rikenellaceae bacterium]
MKLSDVSSEQYAIINHVGGDESFVKRVAEMGFIKGRKVFVVKNAPLKDPIEYHLMGYSVSLRRKESRLIDVTVVENGDSVNDSETTPLQSEPTNVLYHKQHDSKHKEINVALVGNPNCGKTTLFNFMANKDEHVGNYSGVTIDSKVASVEFKGYTINITDLPGTYSLTTYSPEEIVVRDILTENEFNFIINVIDSTVLERNLFLTSQLLDLGCEVIVAMNMYDELQTSGDTFDYKTMSKLFASPFIPTVAKRGRGVAQILDEIVKKYENNTEPRVKVVSNLGGLLEEKVQKIEELLVSENNNKIPTRFSAIMLLERNSYFIDKFSSEINEKCSALSKKIEAEYKESITSVFADARYGYIAGALKETLTLNSNRHKKSKQIDNLLTNKYWGFPFFIAIMWLIFFATFYLGEYPQMALEYCFALLQDATTTFIPEGVLQDLLSEGIIGGIGGVLVFLPNILLLFLFISILEDSGYMARAAFIMDKLMHKIGLHGKSFIPLVMGFGCNVPAIMATRIIEDNKNRLLTILISPFMSCSARLPVYLLIVGAFFPEYASLVLFGIYMLGIILAIVSSLIFKKFLIKGEDQPFVMELPPYRIPSAKSTIKHMWNKGSQYLHKMGGIILVASMIIWTLSYFPNQENSYLKKIGHTVEPVVAPLGFDWKIGVGLISGIAAKEIVVSTMGVINNIEADGEDGERDLTNMLKKDTHSNGELVFTTATAFSFLAFVLIYFPCFAVIAAIRKETGLWRWAVFVMVYTTSLAWLVSFAIYNLLS